MASAEPLLKSERSKATRGTCPLVSSFLSGLPRSADSKHDAMLITVEKLLLNNDTHFTSTQTLCTGQDAGTVLAHPNVEKPEDSHPFDKSCTQALDILCSNGDLWSRLVKTHPLRQVEPDGKKWVDLWCEKNYKYFVNEVDKVIDWAIKKNNWVCWQKVIEKCYYNGFCVMNYGLAPEEMEGFVQYDEYRTFIEWVDEHGKLATNHTTPSAALEAKGKPTRAKLEKQLGDMWAEAKASKGKTFLSGKELRPHTFLHKLASDPKISDKHTDGEVIAMLISMWWSGNFSASVGCSNTLYGMFLYSQKDNANFLKTVRNEVNECYSYEDLAKADTLELALREGLRWRSPVLGSFRRVFQGEGPELYGVKSKVGDMFMVTPRGCQADPKYWGADASVYNPLRWTTEQKQKYPLVSDGPNYFPFGYGDRRCIGAEMAQFFLKATAARFLTQTEFQMKGHWDQWILFGTSQPLKIQARIARRGTTLPAASSGGLTSGACRVLTTILVLALAIFAGVQFKLQHLDQNMIIGISVAAVVLLVGAICYTNAIANVVYEGMTASSVGADRTAQQVASDVEKKVSGLTAWMSVPDAQAIVKTFVEQKRHIKMQEEIDATTQFFLSIAARLVAPPQFVKDVPVPAEKELEPWTASDGRALFFDDNLKIGLPIKGEFYDGPSMVANGAIAHVNETCGFPENDPATKELTGHMNMTSKEYVERIAFGMAVLGDKVPTPNIKYDNLAADATQTNLAFHGPGIYYLKKSGESLGEYVCDTSILQKFKMRSGYEQAGAEAFFDKEKKLTAVRTQRGTFKPGDPLWEHAKYVWRCSCMSYMTVVQHLCWTHWVISNGFSSSCRVLPPNHPVRRVLAVNCFGTAAINQNSTTALHPEFGFLHKLSGFEYESLSQIFQTAANLYKFQTWPEFVESHPLPASDKEELPFFKDGLMVWDIMITFYTKYIDMYYKDEAAVQADKHLAKYWEFGLVPQYKNGLPPLSKKALVQQIAHSAFHVTAWHEMVGGLMPYVSSPDGMFYGVRKTEPPLVRADAHMYVGTLALTSATGGKMPSFVADWSHLLLDEAKKWHQEYMDALRNMKITDETKYRDFLPTLWESSVSV